MNIKDIPHDMTTKLGESLSVIAVNEEDMRKGVEFLISKSNEADQFKAEAKLKFLVGVYSRIIGDFQQSYIYLRNAFKLYRDNEVEDQALLVELRLGVTYYHMEKYSSADEIFRNTIDLAKKSQSKAAEKQLDYAYLHLGKSMFYQGFPQKALDCMVKALEIRLAKGDMEQITAIQQDIDFVKKSIEEAN